VVLYPYRCTDGCEIWHGGVDRCPLLRVEFHPHLRNVSALRGEKPQNCHLSITMLALCAARNAAGKNGLVYHSIGCEYNFTNGNGFPVGLRVT